MKKIITVLAFAATLVSNAQTPVVSSTEEVKSIVVSSLEQWVQSDTFRKDFAKKKLQSGTYKYKFTIGKNGKVISILNLGREGGDIPTQNTLIQNIKAFKFKMKTPKGRDFMFEHAVKL